MCLCKLYTDVRKKGNIFNAKTLQQVVKVPCTNEKIKDEREQEQRKTHKITEQHYRKTSANNNKFCTLQLVMLLNKKKHRIKYKINYKITKIVQHFEFWTQSKIETHYIVCIVHMVFTIYKNVK